jgi:long-chain acyl-CoA synthetase
MNEAGKLAGKKRDCMGNLVTPEQPADPFEGMDTLGDITRVHALARPDAVAFDFEGRRTTYAQLDAHANQVAHALRAAGVGHGQRIAFIGKNCDHYFELLFGAAKAGCVMVPIGWRLAPAEMAFIADNAEARLLFVGPDLADIVAATPDLCTRPVVTLEPHGDWPTYADWRDAQPSEDPGLPVDPADVVVQLYTSGTTGKPKGAVLTHARSSPAASSGRGRGNAPWQEPIPGDVSLLAMPCFHIGGTGWGIVTMVKRRQGHRRALSSTRPRRSTYIANFNISKMFLVPAAIQILLNHPRVSEVDFSRLKYILYGASPIPLELMREAMRGVRLRLCAACTG